MKLTDIIEISACHILRNGLTYPLFATSSTGADKAFVEGESTMIGLPNATYSFVNASLKIFLNLIKGDEVYIEYKKFPNSIGGVGILSNLTGYYAYLTEVTGSWKNVYDLAMSYIPFTAIHYQNLKANK